MYCVYYPTLGIVHPAWLGPCWHHHVSWVLPWLDKQKNIVIPHAHYARAIVEKLLCPLSSHVSRSNQKYDRFNAHNFILAMLYNCCRLSFCTLNSNAFQEALPFFYKRCTMKCTSQSISHAKIVIAAADGCAERPEGRSHVNHQDQWLRLSKCWNNGVLPEKKMPQVHHPLYFKYSS